MKRERKRERKRHPGSDGERMKVCNECLLLLLGIPFFPTFFLSSHHHRDHHHFKSRTHSFKNFFLWFLSENQRKRERERISPSDTFLLKNTDQKLLRTKIIMISHFWFPTDFLALSTHHSITHSLSLSLIFRLSSANQENQTIDKGRKHEETLTFAHSTFHPSFPFSWIQNVE